MNNTQEEKEMNKHKKRMLVLMLTLSIFTINTVPTFAGVVADGTYIANPGGDSSGGSSTSSDGTSSGISSGGSGTGTSGGSSTPGSSMPAQSDPTPKPAKPGSSKNNPIVRNVTPPTQDDIDASKVNWNTVREHLNQNKDNGKIGSIFALPVQTETIKTQYYKDQNTDGTTTWYKIQTFIPALQVEFKYLNSNSRTTANKTTAFYNWNTIEAPTNGIQVDGKFVSKWTTPSIVSKVSFFQVGQYKFSSVPHMKWDIYAEDSFSATLVRYPYGSRSGKAITTRSYAFRGAFVANGEADDNTKLKTYNTKITVFDLNKTVTITSTYSTENVDADVRLIQ